MLTYRWKLLEEILRWNCDVIVLQEVDHHHDWLSPKLAKEGYRSLFVKKPIAPGIAFNPHLEDGCSLFYRAAAPAPAPAPATAVAPGEESVRTTSATTATTLDLLDAHSFTLAVVEHDDNSSGSSPAGPVAGNQVALLSLLRVPSADGGGVGVGDAVGGDREETLVIVATTHLKAAKTAHGEVIRARQVSSFLVDFLFLLQETKVFLLFTPSAPPS